MDRMVAIMLALLSIVAPALTMFIPTEQGMDGQMLQMEKANPNQNLQVFTWRSPFADSTCAHSTLNMDVGTASRQTCTLPPNAAAAASISDLVLDSPQDVVIYFSPSWNTWSASGSAMIYGAVPTSNMTFLYVQLVNSSGEWLDACPLSAYGSMLTPTVPMGSAGGAPGLSPSRLASVSSIGWVPPLPTAAGFRPIRSLTVSDGVLFTVDGVAPDGQERASQFVAMYSALLPKLLPVVKHPEPDW
jgi:hypothetical protein